MTTYILSPEVRAALNQKSVWMGIWAVSKDWGLVLLAFALCLLWPHPLTYLVALLLIAGAQVGLAILTHDAAHRALFSNAKLNDFVAEYLCALPIFNSLAGYRRYHMMHHRMAGTPDDPDLIMSERFPISKASLLRKCLRDVTGQSGVKFLIAVVGMMAGYWKYQQNGLAERIQYEPPLRFGGYVRIFVQNHGLIAIGWQVAIWAVLFSLGHGMLFLLWVGAYIVPLPLFMRLRQIADHAMVEDMYSTNPLLHARSTQATWLAKLLISPHHEHYHLEHHLLPTAPSWNLPKLHAILVKEGMIPPANQATGMLDVLRRVTSSK